MIPALLPLSGGLGSALIVGALSGALSAGAARAATNWLTGNDILDGVPTSMLIGAGLGAIGAGIGYGAAAIVARKAAQNSASAIRPFGELPSVSGLERHHLIEQRFAETLGVNAREIPTVYLAPSEHQPITQSWRQFVGYSNSRNPLTTANATLDDIWNAATQIYADQPSWLRAVEEFLFSH